MSRRTSLAAVVLLVAVILIGLARRGSHSEPERVLPPVAESSPSAQESAVTESRVEPSERAAIADPVRLMAVSGTVRDANSTLAGATVSLWYDEHSPAAALGQVVTGTDGAFSFPVANDRTYMLACTAPGHEEGGGEARPGMPVEVYLASREASTELFGRVQAPDSVPVTSFTINVSSKRGRDWQSAYSSKLLQSPTGEFRIQVQSRTKSSTFVVQASAPGFDSGSKEVKDVREGTSTDVGAIELKPLRTALEGIVEDALTKKPIAGAHLQALCDPPGEQRDVESGADGTFQLSVLPEQVLSAVSVWADGYAPRMIEIGHPDGPLHVELGSGATIHGVVTCVGDAKLGELSVVCWAQQRRQDGPFEATHLRGIARVGPTGEYELQHVAVAPLYIGLERRLSGTERHEVHYDQIQTVSPKEGQRTDLDFRIGGGLRISVPIRPTMRRALVFGRLLDASGQLIATTEGEWGSNMTFTDVPIGRCEVRVWLRDPEHFLARTVDVDQQDVELPEWDITAVREKH